MSFAFWNAVHNLIAHPLMAWPGELPGWIGRFHDWTARKAYGDSATFEG